MIITTIFFITMTAICAEKTVKYAAVIYRHGDRTPVNQYPTDPWKDQALWPVKFGELTNLGKKQHFALGQWLRKRYVDLIPEVFNSNEVNIRSTDVDRTLMSAQANLAGLFPPIGDAIWNEDLMWQPIPVHTKPEKEDELLAMKRKCIPYNKEKEKYENSADYKDKLSKYQGLMDFLTAYTGRKIMNYADINDIYNVLYIESLYNFTLPGWTQAIYPEKIEEPACYSFSTNAATPRMARLMVGPLIKEIVNTMSDVIKDEKAYPMRVSIYSGHDLTIGNILTALGLFDGNCPVYTSTIFLELIEDTTTKSHSVQISYRNSVELVEPTVLEIPHCGEICLFSRFVYLYDNLITVDWNFECNKQISVLFAVGFFGIAFTILYFIHKAHYDKMNHQQRVQNAYNNAFPQDVRVKSSGI